MREPHDAAAESVELGLEVIRAIVKVLVHVAERVLDVRHRVDRALRDAEPHAALEKDEGAANPADERPRRICDDVLRFDAMAVEADAPGARPFHAGELRAGPQLGAALKAQHEHDFVRRLVVRAEH